MINQLDNSFRFANARQDPANIGSKKRARGGFPRNNYYSTRQNRVHPNE